MNNRIIFWVGGSVTFVLVIALAVYGLYRYRATNTGMPNSGGMSFAKCGDGVCDQIEKLKGLCVQDCANNPSSNETGSISGQQQSSQGNQSTVAEGKTLEKVLTKDITPSGKSSLARPDSTVIGDLFYVAYLSLKDSKFYLLRLDQDLNIKSDTKIYSDDTTGYKATDIRIANDTKNIWYAFESILFPNSERKCENLLNLAKYDTDLNLLGKIRGIAKGCPSAVAINVKTVAVDDPAPFFHNGKYYIDARTFAGTTQHIYVYNPDLSKAENFDLDLSGVLANLGTLSQNSLLEIDGRVYLLGAVADRAPISPGARSEIYAIPLSDDLKSVQGNIIQLTNSDKYESYVVGARYADGKLYITYNYNEGVKTGEEGMPGYLEVFDVKNNFQSLTKILINDGGNFDNHFTLEVIGDRVYVFFQTPEDRLSAEIFEWR